MMEEDTSKKVEVDKKPSKPRCRMKKLLNRVQELLDFYFSDVNLNHDRFLRQEIEKSTDGYVYLSTMLKFNKLKQMTSDTTILAKAVGNSTHLELSEDHQKVRRKTKLCELENTDLRTVYVEEFPLNIDHDWLKLVFSTCGTVQYISLPKFKHNNQVKGFAFIEFTTCEEAQKACQVLNTIRCKNKKRLSTECRSEDESPKKKNNRKRRSNSECDGNRNTNQQNTKRRRSVSESSEGSPVKMNRRKRQSSLCSTEEVENEGVHKVEKTVTINTKCDNLLPISTKKRRSKDTSVSSEDENKSVCVKINESASVIQKGNNNLFTDILAPPVPLTTKTTTISRKRKASESKENEINKEKMIKELKCSKDVNPLPTTSVISKETDSSISENTKDDSLKGDSLKGDSHKSESHKGDSCVNVTDPNAKLDSAVKVGDSQPDDSQDKVADSQGKVCEPDGEVVASDKKTDCIDKLVTNKLIDNLPAVSEHSDTKPQEYKRKVTSTSNIKEFESPGKKIKIDETSLCEKVTINEYSKDVPKETVSECIEKRKEECEESGTVKEEIMNKKKKNRQHKKKGEKITSGVSVPPLHVIPKSEWLTLKKEYKRVQRIKMSELKRNLKVLKSEQVRRTELKQRIIHTISSKGVNEETGLIKENVDEEKKPDVDEEKENYQDSNVTSKVESDQGDAIKSVDTKSKGLNVIPGTVVALKTSSENLTRKDIKSTLSIFGQVAYVDYVDGVYQGFVRFVSTDDVEKVMSASSTDNQAWVFQLRKLSCEEENEYFRKAEEDRLKKYNKDQRKKRKKGRGIDKITRDVEEVSNHVHFT